MSPFLPSPFLTSLSRRHVLSQFVCAALDSGLSVLNCATVDCYLQIVENRVEPLRPIGKEEQCLCDTLAIVNMICHDMPNTRRRISKHLMLGGNVHP